MVVNASGDDFPHSPVQHLKMSQFNLVDAAVSVKLWMPVIHFSDTYKVMFITYELYGCTTLSDFIPASDFA